MFKYPFILTLQLISLYLASIFHINSAPAKSFSASEDLLSTYLCTKLLLLFFTKKYETFLFIYGLFVMSLKN